MKRICAWLISVVLILALAVPALAIVDRPEGYVGDYANVLSSATEDHINEMNEALNAATGGAIVVVSVDFMDGMTADRYAKACFDAWGIGDKEKNNGLLLVFAVGENRCWATAGRGIEGTFDASALDGMMEDYFYNDYDSGNYDAAARGFFDAAYDRFESSYGPFTSGGQVSGNYPPRREQSGAAELASLVLVIVVIVVVVVVAVALDGMRYRRYRRRYFGLPGYTYVPFIFGRPRRRYRRPPPPPRPPRGPRPPMGGGWHGNPFGGGMSRGGGAGRSGGHSRSGGSFGGFGGFSGRSGGFGGRSGGFGGGMSRGGGAGRR